jgi:hypothetical protein
MSAQQNDMAVGARFKISELGRRRLPHFANKTGTVFEVSPRTTGIIVLFDDAKRSTVLHRDYIAPLSE